MQKYLPISVNHTLSLAACLPLLHACAGIGAVSGEMPLKVESTPTGATVFVMDKPVGQTPISISQQQLYPAGYDPSTHKLYGSLVVKKGGCQDFIKRIRYQDFNQALTIKLKCDELPERQSLQPSSSNRVISAPTEIPTSQSNDTQTPSINQRAHEKSAAQVTPDEQSVESKKANRIEERGSLTIKQRLLRLDNLKLEGLITDEEYQQARRNILDEL